MAVDDSSPRRGSDPSTIGERLGEDIDLFTRVTSNFYRGEIERTTAWRSRLDQTTNWAVVLVAAILTWAFSSPDNPHYVILIGVFGVVAFLVMEANRYREYDIWRKRVRTIQEQVFAALYDPGTPIDEDWRGTIATDLREPTFSISTWQAIAHRLRRAYLALVSLLLAAWVARITVFQADETWTETASILAGPGETVVAAVGVLYLALVLVALASARGTTVREFAQ
jgi:uncharacterized membrane protein